MSVIPVTLRDGIVTLEPITGAHAADLHAAIDEGVFTYMPMRSRVVTLAEVRRYIEFQHRRPGTIAFAVIDNGTGRAIGSTSYMTIRPEHRGLEIGSTWITRDARGTMINPAMKRLLLAHAFETLGAIRVELKTDARNLRSRSAILKLGAVFEGILRHHLIMPDGHLRDTAMYSITRGEWAGVDVKLRRRLGMETAQ